EIDVLCFVPPHTAARLAGDQPAKMAKDGNEEADAARGKVVYIAVQAHPETGNLAVKVRFPNRALRLKANAVLRVEVLTTPEKERLTIPEAAVMEDVELPAVVVVEGVETKKDEHGHDEKIGKVRKLRPILGVRDRHRHVVELLGLEDPEKKGPENRVKPEG